MFIVAAGAVAVLVGLPCVGLQGLRTVRPRVDSAPCGCIVGPIRVYRAMLCRSADMRLDVVCPSVCRQSHVTLRYHDGLRSNFWKILSRLISEMQSWCQGIAYIETTNCESYGHVIECQSANSSIAWFLLR